MDGHILQEVKRRTKAVSQLFNGYTTYDGQLGAIQDVLVTEVSHDKKHYVGHNKTYDQVLIPMEKRYLGKMVRVNIFETGKHFLKGEPLPGQFLDNVETEVVDLDPAWPSPGKLSTKDGDFGEGNGDDDDCCGTCGDNGGGCSSGDCGSGGDGDDCGEGDCGEGDCGEGDACCKTSSPSASDVKNDATAIPSPVKEEKSDFISTEKGKRTICLFGQVGHFVVAVAICYRVAEVML